jgi:small ligand-binding sensory domain FIST
MSSKFFSSALSQAQDPLAAVEEIASKINRDLGGKSCNVAILFVSEGYKNLNPEVLSGRLRKLLSPSFFLGCNSSGVIGDKREVEMRPAVSCLAMHLPSVKISPFSFSSVGIQTIDTGKKLLNQMDIYPTDQPKFLLLGDPVSTDVSWLLSVFNEAYPACPVVGGMASGTVLGTSNWLVLNDEA